MKKCGIHQWPHEITDLTLPSSNTFLFDDIKVKFEHTFQNRWFVMSS